MTSYPQESPSPLLQSQLQLQIPPAKASVVSTKNTDHFDYGKWQYLLRQLHRHRWPDKGKGAITWAFVMRMRTRYGSRVVDSALSDCALNDSAPVLSAAGYFQATCERFKTVAES